MSWVLHILWLSGFTTCLLLVYRLGDQSLRARSHSGVWTKLDTVGIASHDRLSWIRAIASSIVSTRKWTLEGYVKFSKALNRPFALPNIWTGKAVVVLPPSQIPILTRPDKITGDKWTNLPGMIETVQFPYVLPDPNIYENTLHFDVVRRHMTSTKDMASMAATTAEEIDLAFCDIWGTSQEWRVINGWDMCGRVIARTAQRILIGLPISRDADLLEASRLYATSLLLGGAIMNCFPPIARRVVGPLIALYPRYYQARCVKALKLVVQERTRTWGQSKTESAETGDFLQWMIPFCAKEGPGQMKPERIALRLVALLTPLMFAICYVFSHSVLDLYGSPQRDDYVSELEAECKKVSKSHGGLDKREAVDALRHVDSTLRESMRVSEVAVFNLFRDVISGSVDIGNGILIPPGVRMVFPTQNIHLDPDNYEDPRRFDAFRFSRESEPGIVRDQSGQRTERKLLTTTSPSFLPWGYGRHACPGRWFAAQTMKQALAYIVMNYDVELVGKPIKRRALLNTMVPPVESRLRIRRKN